MNFVYSISGYHQGILQVTEFQDYIGLNNMEVYFSPKIHNSGQLNCVLNSNPVAQNPQESSLLLVSYFTILILWPSSIWPKTAAGACWSNIPDSQED